MISAAAAPPLVTSTSPLSSLPPSSNPSASSPASRQFVHPEVSTPRRTPRKRERRISRLEDTPRKETWNAIAILRGSDSELKDEVILLTAHLDHLGVAQPINGDAIFNGADDDASGTTAILTLAHIFATGPRPKRTIIFALFGSEELGGFGARAFLANPPVPLHNIVANLEFEMIGRPDPAVPGDTLWLTGYERSNLGPELANTTPTSSRTLTRKKTSSSGQTTSASPVRASSPTPSPALASTPTITNPPTNSTPSTSPTWLTPSPP